MDDILEELRKLDPQKQVRYLHTEDEFHAGDDILLEEWVSLRMIDDRELSEDFAWAMDNLVDMIPVEVNTGTQKYWLVITVIKPNSFRLKQTQTEFVVGLPIETVKSSYAIKGMILPANKRLVPEDVVPILGDFIYKRDEILNTCKSCGKELEENFFGVYKPCECGGNYDSIL